MDEVVMNAMLEADEHHWWYRGRRRVIGAELQRLGIGDGLRVLDAGCGSGRTMVELRRYGVVSGLELNPDAAQIARDRGVGEVRVGRLEELPWEPGSFDLITCLDVIEHTPQDTVALTDLRRVCTPGGHLLVTVPAYPRLWSRHDEANHHFRRYTRPSLRAAATQAGWRVERVSSFNALLLAPAAAVRLAQRRQGSSNGYTNDLAIGPAWLNSALEGLLGAEARWLRRGNTLPAGLSLLAVLRAP